MQKQIETSKSVVVDGHGVIVRYGFVTQQIHTQLQATHKESVPIDSLKVHCKKVACKGFFSKHLKISIASDTILQSLEDIKTLFPITFYPDTGLINFGTRKKYALVHLQHLTGRWVDDVISMRGFKDLIFQHQYHDFNAKHHFPIFELKRRGQPLKEGKLITTQEEFYLFDADKTETRLHYKI